MKGLSNFLPSFTRIAISLLCTLCITSNVLAQDKTATVNVKDVTVKELLKAIEAGRFFSATSPRLPDNPRRRLRSRKLHGQLQEESLTKTGSR